MPRRARTRAEDRLRRVEKELAALLARRPVSSGRTYRQRMHDECLALLTERLREIGGLAADGNTPPEQLEKLRWIAHEGFRRGRPVGEADFDAAHAAAPVAAPKQDVQLEPREWKPRPRERDVLAGYRDQRSNHPDGLRSLEPEFL